MILLESPLQRSVAIYDRLSASSFRCSGNVDRIGSPQITFRLAIILLLKIPHNFSFKLRKMIKNDEIPVPSAITSNHYFWQRSRVASLHGPENSREFCRLSGTHMNEAQNAPNQN